MHASYARQGGEAFAASIKKGGGIKRSNIKIGNFDRVGLIKQQGFLEKNKVVSKII